MGSRFHHISLNVRSMEAAQRFYGMLGFDPVYDWRAEDGSLAIAHMRLDHALLELFCYASPNEPTAPPTSLDEALRIVGLLHFGVLVDDLDAAVMKMAPYLAPETQQIVHGRTGLDYVFAVDPDGNYVELVRDPRDLI